MLMLLVADGGQRLSHQRSAGPTLTFHAGGHSWADAEDPGTNNGTGTYLRVDGSPLRKCTCVRLASLRPL